MTITINLKHANYWLKIIVLGVALGFIIQFARAWVDPQGEPPAGNVGAPINTSTVAQGKLGPIIIGGANHGNPWGLLVKYGNVGIGTDNPQEKLQVFGKARVDDACLNSDPSKCLSNAGIQPTPHALHGTCRETSTNGMCSFPYMTRCDAANSPAYCSGDICVCEGGYSLTITGESVNYTSCGDPAGLQVTGSTKFYSCYKN